MVHIYIIIAWIAITDSLHDEWPINGKKSKVRATNGLTEVPPYLTLLGKLRVIYCQYFGASFKLHLMEFNTLQFSL